MKWVVPDGFILADIMLTVMIVVVMGSIGLVVLSMFLNEAIDTVIRIKRELIEEEE